jgi:hypothetical protein
MLFPFIVALGLCYGLRRIGPMVGRPEFPDAALPGASQCGEPANENDGGCSEDLRAMRQRIDIISLLHFCLAENLLAPDLPNG